MKTVLTRSLALALALAGATIVIMLVRAASLRPESVPEGTPSPFSFDELGAPARLAELLRIGSGVAAGPASDATVPGPTAAPGPPGWQGYLVEAFPETHAALEWEALPGGSILLRWPGTDEELSPFLVVARLGRRSPLQAEEEAGHRAPTGTIDGGYIRGRGTITGTGAAAGILEAFEGLVREGFRPRRTILLALTGDGQPGSDATSEVVRVLREDGLRAAWVLSEGLYLTSTMIPGIRDPVGVVGVTYKRGLDLRILARREGGTPMLPPRATASGALGEAVRRLEDETFTPEIRGPNQDLLRIVGPHMDPGTRLLVANLWLLERPFASALTERTWMNAFLRTTPGVTELYAGSDQEGLPTEATAHVHLRLAPWDSVESVLERIRLALSDLEVEVQVADPAAGRATIEAETPFESSVQTEGFRILRESIHRSFPDVVSVVPGVIPWETDFEAYSALSEAVYGFAPFRVDPETIDNLGTDEERVRISVYLDAIRFYAELLREGSS